MQEGSDGPTWLSILIAVTPFVALFGFMTYIVRKHNRPEDPSKREKLALPEDDGSTVTLSHSWQLLFVGTIGIATFWGSGGLTVLLGEEEIAGVILILFGLSSAYLIAEYFRARHLLTSQGLTYQRLFGGGGTIHWNDITRVRFGLISHWVKLTNHTGDTIRVSVYSQNSIKFAVRILQNVDASRIDPGAQKTLERIASGDTFSVWRRL